MSRFEPKFDPNSMYILLGGLPIVLSNCTGSPGQYDSQGRILLSGENLINAGIRSQELGSGVCGICKKPKENLVLFVKRINSHRFEATIACAECADFEVEMEGMTRDSIYRL